jgi:peroxiredoxin
MPKYNPKEARDARKRKQKRVTKNKKEINFRKFLPYIFIIGAVIIVGGIGIYYFLTQNNNSEDSGENGGNGDNTQYGTDMTFTTIDGGTINLADNQGKVVILYFFDLDCYYCGPEANILADIEDEYTSSQLEIILIDVHYYDSISKLKTWRENYNSNWDIVLDDVSSTYGKAFDIAYTPTTKILDNNGNIVNTIYGYDEGHYSTIKDEINALL